MARKKNFWYVLVLTEGGPVLVTDVDYADKNAYWNKLEIPKEFTESMAKDLALGLMCNGHLAFAITNPYKLETQLYYYNKGHFEWVKEEEK